MRRKNSEANNVHPLLALCAQVYSDEEHSRLVAETANQLRDWENIPRLAEAQGMGPLLLYHVRKAGVQIPRPAKLALSSMYLRNQERQRVYLKILQKVVASFREAGIEALVLKGARLAPSIYPDPALRPMQDIDLLLRRSEIPNATHLLIEQGFLPEEEAFWMPRHVAPIVAAEEGMTISVELHYSLWHTVIPCAVAANELFSRSIDVDLKGVRARSLSHEDTLWHLLQHMLFSFRLLSLADFVGYASCMCGVLNWDFIRSKYPQVINALWLFDLINPVPAELRAHLPDRTGVKPEGTGVALSGWPAKSLRKSGKVSSLLRSFWPSQWWLLLCYGRIRLRPMAWYRWVVHPLHLAALFCLRGYHLGGYLLRKALRLVQARIKRPGRGEC